MIGLKDFLVKIKSELLADRPLVLAMIAEKKGSAPRGTGAHMLILQNGDTVDTIGGGILEYLAVEQAKANLAEKKSAIKDFSLNNKTAAQIGMVCGGQIKVLLKYLDKNDLPQIETAINLLGSGQKAVVKITWQKEPAQFSFIVLPYTEKMQLKHKSLLQIDETGGCYMEVLRQNPTVYLFGGGYVAQEVAKLLPSLEFECVVIEERSEFANRNYFPQASDIIITPYEEFAAKVQIKNTDFAVVITSGHEKDTVVLNELLKIKPAYIGAIGSRHKKAFVEKFLREQGYGEKAIKSIIMPIGLDIKAQTPAEIAISIAAQLIEKRAQ